jgi:hypothetical protein
MADYDNRVIAVQFRHSLCSQLSQLLIVQISRRKEERGGGFATFHIIKSIRERRAPKG